MEIALHLLPLALPLVLPISWSILCVVAIYKIRDKLYSLLDAIIKIIENIGNKATNITFGGLGINLGSATSILPNGELKNINGKYQELQKTFQNQVVTDEEKIIKNQLIEAKLSNEQAVDVLIYHLANANFHYKMIIVDTQIYPEQIELLSYLNSQNNPCEKRKLSDFYTKWEARTKSNTSFTIFLGFLLQHGLVLKDNNRYYITILGREYLIFQLRLGR